MRQILSTVLLVVVFGCDSGAPGGERAVIQDSAGVRIVRLPEDLGYAPLVTLSLDESWRSMAGSDGELVDIAAFSDGRLAVLDPLSAAVSLLAPDGSTRSRMGRPGEGPGELSGGGLDRVLATDSSVVVPDLFQQRITEFALSGDVRSVRPFPGGGGYAVEWQLDPAGGLVYRLLRPDGDLLLRASASSVDTLHRFPGQEERPNQLLPAVAIWSLSDARLAVARSDAWAVDLFAMPGGKHLLGVRRDAEAAPFTVSDRSSLIDVLEASASREAGGRELGVSEREALLSQVSFPEVAPLVAGLLLAPTGDVWVREAKPVSAMDRQALRVGSAAGYGGPDWIVLDTSGAVRARVRLPDGFTPRVFVNPLLYGIARDTLGVARPARVRIPWAPSTPASE